MKAFLAFLFILRAAAAADPGPNTDWLQRTGKAVEKFWDQLQAVDCVESVDQQKLSPNGKTTFRQQSAFDYIAILELTGNDLIVDESRTPVRQPAHETKLPLLITNGFPTFEFIFHPFYQGAFEFSPPERVRVEGQDLLEVKFRHVRGAKSTSVLKLRQREYPVEWMGTAWIEPASSAIVRITAGLMTSMEDIGLKSMTADVRYSRVDFNGEQISHWLPSSAVIEVETPRQHWRNVHTFDQYKRFAVDVKTEIGKAK